MNNLEKGILTKIAILYPISLEETKRIYDKVKSFDKTIEIIEEMYRTAIGNPTTILEYLFNKKWEKEFEDKARYFFYDSGLSFEKVDIKELLETYLDIKEDFDENYPVKIKVRKGCIQIERKE